MVTINNFSIVQLSDAHVYEEESHEVYGVVPIANLKAAVHSINSIRPLPSLCIYTGDAVSIKSEKAYLLFKEQIQLLKIPVHYAMGNHDNRMLLRRQLLNESEISDGPYYYAIHQAGWRIVILDTSVPGEVWGQINKQQLIWLEEILRDDMPTFIFMHHHPVPVGVPWIDNLMLKKPDQLIKILQQAGCVHSVFFGHIHFECHIEVQNLQFMSVPSISFQFSEIPHKKKIASNPPGFRLIQVNTNIVRSIVHRLTYEELNTYF